MPVARSAAHRLKSSIAMGLRLAKLPSYARAVSEVRARSAALGEHRIEDALAQGPSRAPGPATAMSDLRPPRAPVAREISTDVAVESLALLISIAHVLHGHKLIPSFTQLSTSQHRAAAWVRLTVGTCAAGAVK